MQRPEDNSEVNTRVAKRRDDTGGSRVIEVGESREDKEVDSRGRGTIWVVEPRVVEY